MNGQLAGELKLSDFDFDLPEELIAQEPCTKRDESRLMVLNRRSESISHTIFQDLERFLLPGDLLVLNDTKVYPCRILARKPSGGKAEIFLLSENGLNSWEALLKGGAKVGTRLKLDSGIEAEITAERPDATWTVIFHGIQDIKTALPLIGKVPLPPYIKREATERDRERYQTVYATSEGAVAAPTAGLHFTPGLIDKLRVYGIDFATVTLHVGPGTFQPVRVDVISEHRMLPERYIISPDAAARINNAKNEGRRVIAVGTTSVRAVESAAQATGEVPAGAGASRLFIYPGYTFKTIDGMITNFHLPKSTLFMLVSAFSGRERMLNAYRTAVVEKYRFYSYGDAMLIL